MEFEVSIDFRIGWRFWHGGPSLKATNSLFVALSSCRIAFLARFGGQESNGRFLYSLHQVGTSDANPCFHR